MSMTVAKLHKILSVFIAKGEGRCRVCVNKPSFRHTLEDDGCVILDVESVDIHQMPLIDPDGGMAVTARGQERTFRCLVFDGGNDPSLDPPTP